MVSLTANISPNHQQILIPLSQ